MLTVSISKASIKRKSIPYNTRKEAGLEEAEQEPACNQACQILDESRESCHNAPGKTETGDIIRRLHLLDNHVGRGFEELAECQYMLPEATAGSYAICNKQDRDGQLILVATETKIIFQAIQTSIADVD
jgi:hypothetical protein